MHQNNLIPSGFEACTPSDSAFVNYVGVTANTAGTVVIVDSRGNTTTWTVSAGQTIVGQIVQVKDTGTTDGISLIGSLA